MSPDYAIALLHQRATRRPCLFLPGVWGAHCGAAWQPAISGGPLPDARTYRSLPGGSPYRDPAGWRGMVFRGGRGEGLRLAPV
jgi:hypothetical protein